MLEKAMADELSAAWRAAQKESGYSIESAMSAEEKSSEKFFSLFEEQTGIEQYQIIGMFHDWNKLTHEEMSEIQERTMSSVPFCGYIAKRLCEVLGARSTSTAYCVEDFDGEEN